MTRHLFRELIPGLLITSAFAVFAIAITPRAQEVVRYHTVSEHMLSQPGSVLVTQHEIDQAVRATEEQAD